MPPVAHRRRRRTGALVAVALTLCIACGTPNLTGRAAHEDADGDSLPDDLERFLTTNPRNPDTDSDGLLDADDPCPLLAGRGYEGPERAPRQAIVDFLVGLFGSRPRLVAVSRERGEPAICFERLSARQLHDRRVPWEHAQLQIRSFEIDGDRATAEAGLVAPMYGCWYRFELERFESTWMVVGAQRTLCA